MSAVVKVVKKVVKTVANAVESVVDFVIDDVIKPVVKGVGDIIDYALDNPIEAIAAVALTAVGAPAWSIALVNGATTLAKGGDIGDALKAAAVSYAGSTLGAASKTYVTASLAKAGVSSTVANIVGSGTQSATRALVYGQDPLKAFAVGGLQAGAAAALGEVDEYMRETYGKNFEDLRGGVKDTIFAGISAELEGGSLDPTQMTKIVSKYAGVADYVQNFLEENAGLNEAAAAMVTSAVSNAATKALMGNPELSGEAFFGTIRNESNQALKELIDEKVYKQIDKITGAYNTSEEKANALNNAITNAEAAANNYNNTQAQIRSRLDRQDELQSEYDTALAAYNANKTQANADRVNAAAGAFNSYVDQIRDEIDTLAAQADTYRQQFDTYNNQIPGLQEEYDQAFTWMMSDVEDLDAEMAPRLSAADRAVTLQLRPNFDEDAYREAAGLDADADVYDHYLTQGQNLPTDRTAVNTALNTARQQLVFNALANQGVDWSTLAPEQLEAAFDYAKNEVRSISGITGLDFNNFAENALAAATEATPRGEVFPESYQRASGVTDTDIATGNATLYNNDGKLEWRNTSTIREDLNGTTVNIEEGADGTLTGLIDTALQSPDGTASSASGGITIRLPNMVTSDTSFTLPELVINSVDNGTPLPTQIVESVVNLGDEATRLLDEYVGEPIGTTIKDLYNHYLKDTTTGNALQNTGSVIVGATGELLQAASGLALLAGANPNNAVGRLADRLLAVGADLRTENYQAAVDEIDSIIGGATGWREKAQAIWDVATDMDTAGVFFAEYVGKEILQEIPILLASGGAGNVAKRALQEAGEQFAQRYAARTAVGTAIGLDMAEAFGGTAAGAYDEAFAVALNTGMSEQEANQYAIEVAQKAGAIATALVGITAGVGGAAFERAILGEGVQDAAMRSMYDRLRDRIIEGGEVTIKEGITEAIEEALPQAYVAMSLSQIDPTYDVSGEIMAAALLGKIAGAGTAAGIYTGDAVADAIFSSNKQVRDTIQNAESPEAAAAALQGLGINDNLVLNNLLNTSYDQFYVSTGEAQTAIERANPQYEFTQAEAEQFVGQQDEANLQQQVDQYVDQRFLDIDEVKAIAASEGITLTDEEAEQFVQQGSTSQIIGAENVVRNNYDSQAVTFEEAKARFESLGFNPTDEQVNNFVGKFDEAQRLNEINQYVDPRQVTEAESRQFLEALGYNPTDEEVQQFIGQGAEGFQDTIGQNVEAYVDPRMVDADEARAAYEALGLTRPTDADIERFVGQYAEEELTGRAEEYLPTARYNSLLEQIDQIAAGGGPGVTEAVEAVKADLQAQIEGLGYTIDEQTGILRDEIAASEERLIAQIQENEAAGMERDEAIQQAISDLAEEFDVSSQAFLDRLGETETSLQEQLEELGTQIGEQVSEQIGELETSILDRVQELEDAGVARDDALNTAIGELATELGTTEESLLSQIGETEQSLLTQLADIEAGLQQQVGDVESSLLNRVQELEDAGIARDEALNTALGELATELGTTEESLLSQIGETEESLLTQIGAVEQQVADVENFLLDRVQELEDAGVSRDEALQTAINEVAGDLGTTRDELLTQIGETEDSLLTQLVDIESGLQEQVSDVETTLLDRVQELEDAGISRDEALQTAIDEVAGDLGTTRDELLTQIDETEDSLLTQLADIESGLQEQVSGLETTLLDRVQELEDSGVARDEALQTAIDELAGDLGTTEENLLAEIGETEQSLLDQLSIAEESLTAGLTDVATALSEQMAQYEAAGIDRDTALSQAIDDVAADLGTTRSELLTQLGETEQSILQGVGEQIGGIQEQLGEFADLSAEEMQYVADLIGKPARAVTQTDVDFVADLIAQQEVISELSRQQQGYDVNADGVIDIQDQQLLEQALLDPNVQLSQESAFVTDPTGIYKQIQDIQTQLQTQQDLQTQQQQDLQTQLQTQQDLNTQLNTQLQTQIQTEADAARRRQFSDYLLRQDDLYGQRVDVRTPDPMRINYLYDFSSIFANPQQASLFPSPYAKGGQVEDTTDKLLRIIGDDS